MPAPVVLALTAMLAMAVAPATAHMEMISPAPWRSKNNPNTPEPERDYSYTSPLDASGSNYPCKGYNSVLGTPLGASVAEWAPGSSQKFELAGTATHGGGSCQALFSFDGGNTFKVVRSIEGNCPDIKSWDFTVPHDAPAGEAVFAWTWFNRLGNREMYMNCATVTIGSNGTGRRRANSASLSSLPANFEANIGNGCSTTEGGDVIFPNPGPDYIQGSSNPLPPVGSCGGGGGGGSSGSGSGSGSTNPEKPSASPSPSPSPAASASPNESNSASSAPSAPAWSESSASPSQSATFDDGQWKPSTTGKPTEPTLGGDWGNWHNDGTNSTTSASPVAPTSTKRPGGKCNRRVRRHKKRVHGQVGSF